LWGYFVHGRATGSYTFDYLQLLGTSLSSRAGLWLMLGFFLAFAVKLPAHTSAQLAARRAHGGLPLRERHLGRAC